MAHGRFCDQPLAYRDPGDIQPSEVDYRGSLLFDLHDFLGRMIKNGMTRLTMIWSWVKTLGALLGIMVYFC